MTEKKIKYFEGYREVPEEEINIEETVRDLVNAGLAEVVEVIDGEKFYSLTEAGKQMVVDLGFVTKEELLAVLTDKLN